MSEDKEKKIPDFAKSALQTYDQMIGHYEMVLMDLSGQIYDPKLEAQKAPVIQFLEQVQGQWKACRDSFINQL